ncbi:venom serine protease 34-like, partial [Penaeus monodon]|uniref:venom serine protease 34-like n=1 Tax=Penaeus monodon TaxID=6687 RepID=UPI0018A7821F
MKSAVALLVLVAASLASCRRLALEPKKATRDGVDRPPKAAFRQDLSYGSGAHSMASSFEENYWTSSSAFSGRPPSPQATTTSPPTVNPSTKPPTTGACQCGVANPTRIVGGEEVQPAHKYPWQIGLKYEGGNGYWCGGAVINDRYILTAAHCLFDSEGNQESAEGLVVGVGDHLMSSTSDDVAATELISVEKVILHPQYNKQTFDNDIALLKLSKVLTFSTEVRPVCLPENDSKTYAGAE